LTNDHLDLLRDQGFDRIRADLGYGPIPTLDSGTYTEFQRATVDLLRRGVVADDHPDKVLAGFAFNKSNIDSAAFPFRRFGWKHHTCLERADFRNEPLMMKCWAAADEATGRVNDVLYAILREDWTSDPIAAARRVAGAAHDLLGSHMPRAADALAASLESSIQECLEAPRAGKTFRPGEQPRLIRSVNRVNIVAHRGEYHGIPWELGPLDLSERSVAGLPGVVSDSDYVSVLETVRGSPLP
jgi:plasmid stabilization system protein ParE